MRLGPLLALPLAAALASACQAPAPFVWYHAYHSPQAGTGEYLLAPGDLVAVSVYNQDAMSAKVRVRADGRISLPLVGELEAAGLSPVALSKVIRGKLKEFVVNPIVTVAVEETKPLEIYVVGEVTHPGRFQLDPSASLLQALAVAGGLTPFADPAGIYVVRRERPPARIRFRLEALTSGDGEAAGFRLRGGDTIVVE